MSGGFRYFAGAVAFGFAAVWIMTSLAAALVCLLAAVVAYGVVAVAEGARAKAARTRSGDTSTPRPVPRQMPKQEDLSRWAEALNSDLGHVYEPSTTTSPLSAAAAYGWPLDNETTATRETLH